MVAEPLEKEGGNFAGEPGIRDFGGGVGRPLIEDHFEDGRVILSGEGGAGRDQAKERNEGEDEKGEFHDGDFRRRETTQKTNPKVKRMLREPKMRLVVRKKP